LRHSLLIHRELHDRWRVTSVLAELAALALSRGGAGTAARLLAAAETIREAIGTVIPPCESPMHDETLAGARAELGDDAFAAAWRQGTLTPAEDLEAELAAPGTTAPALRPEAAASDPATATSDPATATRDPGTATRHPAGRGSSRADGRTAAHLTTSR